MESNQVRVSLKKSFTAFVFSAKEVLKQFDTVEIHALGEAATNAVKAADTLVSLGYASFERFDTLTINEADHTDVMRRRFKIIIELKKTPDFDQLYEEFSKKKAIPK